MSRGKQHLFPVILVTFVIFGNIFGRLVFLGTIALKVVQSLIRWHVEETTSTVLPNLQSHCLWKADITALGEMRILDPDKSCVWVTTCWARPPQPLPGAISVPQLLHRLPAQIATNRLVRFLN